MKIARGVVIGLVVVGALFAVSFGVGHCRRWIEDGKPGPPPPTPGRLDPGQPVNAHEPGTPAAPVVPATLETTFEGLDPAARARFLARYGLSEGSQRPRSSPDVPDGRLGPSGGPASAPGSPVGDPDTGTGLAPQPVEIVAQGLTWPLRLSEETFCLEPDPSKGCPEPGPGGLDAPEATSTPTVDVAAVQPCQGCPVDQVARWRPYQPPPPPAKKKGWLGLEGSFAGKLGAGVTGACLEVDGEMHCDGGPGGGAGVALRGWRTGSATWSLELEGGAWAKGGTGHAWLTITWP